MRCTRLWFCAGRAIGLMTPGALCLGSPPPEVGEAIPIAYGQPATPTSGEIRCGEPALEVTPYARPRPRTS